MGADISEFEEIDELEQLRRALRRSQQNLQRVKVKTDELVAATITAAKDAQLALGHILPVPSPKTRDRRTGRPQVALWHLTDWQGSKRTDSYNSEIMRERVMRYCEKAEKITNIQRADHPVRECTIMFGGDLIEGLFNFPAQAWEIDASLFGQFTTVSRLVVDVVRKALGIYDKVQVVSEWGNHGRIGGKRAEVPRADNMDRMIAHLARELLAGEKRLKWEDCPLDMQHVEIGNYRALLIHGDEVGRNGYASPMTIVNHVAKWQSGSHPWPFRDCYLGHYHTHNEWALPNGLGSVYQTGSPESDNRYAGVHMAASATPSQRLHFIDPIKGRVGPQYKIWLDED